MYYNVYKTAVLWIVDKSECTLHDIITIMIKSLKNYFFWNFSSSRSTEMRPDPKLIHVYAGRVTNNVIWNASTFRTASRYLYYTT